MVQRCQCKAFSSHWVSQVSSPDFAAALEAGELPRELGQDIGGQVRIFLKRFTKLCRKPSVTVDDMSEASSWSIPSSIDLRLSVSELMCSPCSPIYPRAQ